MNWTWSRSSSEKLASCHPVLRNVMHCALALSPFDLKIIEGHRGKTRQNELVAQGRSKRLWPRSNHNSFPSRAVDVAPLPLDWQNSFSFHVMCGVVFAAAHLENITAKGWHMRTGQDWDGDWRTTDQTFHDAPHFEIHPVET